MRSGRSALLALCVVAVFGVASCGSKDEANAPRFRIVDAGSGPANAAPLEPLREGTYRADYTVVEGSIDLPSGRGQKLHDLVSGEVTWFTRSADGLFVAGGTADGALAHPTLLVPTTVRVGMKWQVMAGDGDSVDYTYTVESRSDSAPYEWRIDQLRTGDAAPINRYYVEGRGRTYRGTFTRSMLFAPLEAPVPEPIAPLPIALAPLEVDASVDLTKLPDLPNGLSMVQAPGKKALLLYDVTHVAGVGNAGVCLQTDGKSVVAGKLELGAPFRRTEGDVCPTAPDCWSNSSTGNLDCTETVLHADGALVEPDGRIAWIPRVAGGLVPADYRYMGSDLPNAASFFTALMLVPGTQTRVVYGENTLVQTRVGGEYFFDTPLQPEHGENYATPIANDWFATGVTLTSVHPISGGADGGDRSTVLLRTSDYGLWTSKLDGARLTRPKFVGRLGGILSSETTASGTEILRVTGDGSIDRLRVKNGDLALEHVGNATLAPKEQAVGAFVLHDAAGDALLVAVRGADATGAPVLRLLRSTSPLPAAVPVKGPVSGVTLALAGGRDDLLLCRAADGQTPDLSGWTRGDVKATALSPRADGSCVLVLSEDAVSGEQAVLSGTLPGIGRIAVDPNERGGLLGGVVDFGNENVGVVAPLREGGVVGWRRLLGPDAVVEGMADGGGVQAVGEGVIDHAGNGIWHRVPTRNVTTGNVDGLELYLLGRKQLRVDLALPPTNLARPYSVDIEAAMHGGGVVVRFWNSSTPTVAHAYVAPDGKVSLLNESNSSSNYYCGRLSDGTLCGSGSVLFCRSPAGVERTMPQPVGFQVTCKSMFTLSDDSLAFVLWNGDAYRWDTKAMALSRYPGVFTPAVSSTGDVFGLTIDASKKPTISRLLPTGLEALPSLVSVHLSPDTPLFRFAVEDSVFMVIEKDGNVVRIPR